MTQEAEVHARRAARTLDARLGKAADANGSHTIDNPMVARRTRSAVPLPPPSAHRVDRTRAQTPPLTPTLGSTLRSTLDEPRTLDARLRKAADTNGSHTIDNPMAERWTRSAVPLPPQSAHRVDPTRAQTRPLTLAPTSRPDGTAHTWHWALGTSPNAQPIRRAGAIAAGKITLTAEARRDCPHLALGSRHLANCPRDLSAALER